MFLRRCALSLAAGLTLASLPAHADTEAPHAPAVEARIMADQARELMLAEVGANAAGSARSAAPRTLTVLDLFFAKDQMRREIHALRASEDLSEAGLARLEKVVAEVEEQLRAEHPSHFAVNNAQQSNAGYDSQYRSPTIGAGYDNVYRQPVKAIALPETRLVIELRPDGTIEVNGEGIPEERLQLISEHLSTGIVHLREGVSIETGEDGTTVTIDGRPTGFGLVPGLVLPVAPAQESTKPARVGVEVHSMSVEDRDRLSAGVAELRALAGEIAGVEVEPRETAYLRLPGLAFQPQATNTAQAVELGRLVDELLSGIDAGTMSADQRDDLRQRVRELVQQLRELYPQVAEPVAAE